MNSGFLRAAGWPKTFGRNEYVPISSIEQAVPDFDAGLAASRCIDFIHFDEYCAVYGAGCFFVYPLYFVDWDHGLYVCLSDLHYETLAAISYGRP